MKPTFEQNWTAAMGNLPLTDCPVKVQGGGAPISRLGCLLCSNLRAIWFRCVYHPTPFGGWARYPRGTLGRKTLNKSLIPVASREGGEAVLSRQVGTPSESWRRFTQRWSTTDWGWIVLHKIGKFSKSLGGTQERARQDWTGVV